MCSTRPCRFGKGFSLHPLPSNDDIDRAAAAIAPHVHHTPMLTSAALDERVGARVHFKCENMQRSGSFKYRGAMNALLNLTDEEIARGVATHSSGNHGSALAAVAKRVGAHATIVVPRDASRFKREAIARYGGEIVECGVSLSEREAELAEVIASRGSVFIPPYDHPDIVAGQASVGREIVADVPNVEEVWIPVGGGGLAAGTVLGVGELVQVVGAEPELAGDAYASLQTGTRQQAMPPTTCADGLRTALGELNFAILKRYELPIELVEEDEIRAAQRLAMACLKVVVETSAAVPLAALIKYGPHDPAHERVAVVITGGNVELQAR